MELSRISSSGPARYRFTAAAGHTKEGFFLVLHPGGTVLREADYGFNEVSPGVYEVELFRELPLRGAVIECRRTGEPKPRRK